MAVKRKKATFYFLLTFYYVGTKMKRLKYGDTGVWMLLMS